MSIINANNPSHIKIIIIGVFVTLFGVYMKQAIEHSFILDVIGWTITFIGAAISVSGVFKILQD